MNSEDAFEWFLNNTKEQLSKIEPSIIKVESEFGHCCYSFEEDYCHIWDLYVFPEFRRRGKATQLLKTAIQQIKEDGWNKPIKIVAIPMEDSISLKKLKSFYEGLGLEVFTYYG